MSAYQEKTYLSKDGLKLYYRDYPGPSNAPFALLCIPGLTRNSRDFEDVAAYFSAYYRVLCVELRGRGKSEYAKDPMTYQPPQYVQDVGRLFEAAGLDEAVFVGTSLGGLVSMMSAGVLRHRVKAVVLNDVGPEIDPKGLTRIGSYVGKSGGFASWDEAAAKVQANNAAVYPKWLVSDWMTMTRRLCIERADRTVHFDYDPNIAVPFTKLGPTAQVDLWPVFQALNGIPALAVRGMISDILSEDCLKKMKEAVPALTTVEVPQVGHAPYLMEPQAREALSTFFSHLPASGGLGYRLGRRIGSFYHLLRIMKHYKK